jgi:hypothetical protein
MQTPAERLPHAYFRLSLGRPLLVEFKLLTVHCILYTMSSLRLGKLIHPHTGAIADVQPPVLPGLLRVDRDLSELVQPYLNVELR